MLGCKLCQTSGKTPNRVLAPPLCNHSVFACSQRAGGPTGCKQRAKLAVPVLLNHAPLLQLSLSCNIKGGKLGLMCCLGVGYFAEYSGRESEAALWSATSTYLPYISSDL